MNRIQNFGVNRRGNALTRQILFSLRYIAFCLIAALKHFPFSLLRNGLTLCLKAIVLNLKMSGETKYLKENRICRVSALPRRIGGEF